MQREWVGSYVRAVGLLEGRYDVMGYAGCGVWIEFHCFEGEFMKSCLVEDVPF